MKVVAFFCLLVVVVLMGSIALGVQEKMAFEGKFKESFFWKDADSCQFASSISRRPFHRPLTRRDVSNVGFS